MKFKYAPLSLAVASATALFGTGALAQDDIPEYTRLELEEVIVTGTRSQKPRSVADSPVPVDVFSGEEFSATGNAVDITENMRALVPSFIATPYTGDGSAFIRPTTLRGTSPDQTLVLVNGKRRHRSALVTTFAPAAGNGAHGVDIGMVPTMALKSVEVLRDGAASQYGSDAIAGVINFRLKDAPEGGSFMAQYGEHYEGEQTIKVGGNMGFSLTDRGFLNVTVEYTDNEAFDRAILRPDARALIDAGVQGVGSDTPFSDAPKTQTWGRPELEGIRSAFNAGWELSDSSELYLFGGYSETKGRYRFFYRNPEHPQIQSYIDRYGYSGRLTEVGFTGYLDGDQEDISVVGGWRGTMNNGLYYDFSVGYGENELDYYLYNVINLEVGLGPDGEPAQKNFDVGAYKQDEINFNADFSYPISDNLNLAFGGEWREETFEAILGEPNTWISGSTSGSGFSSPVPGDAGEFDRDNWAVYIDVEHDISERWLMQYALRYEDFSDFGDTTNGKIATRFNLTDNIVLRGAVSTGFHAPTPGQANLQAVITTFDGATGQQVEEGLIKATSPQARKYGGTELTEEESVNYSLGFTADIGQNTTLTADYYLIEVDDRIYRTGDIPTDTGGSISFYTNALEIEHEGFDLVLTSFWDWSGGVDTTFTFAYNHNEIEVTGQTLVNGIQPVNDSLVEDIENNYPENRFVFTANTRFAEDWWFMFRANYYGSHYDEQGRIGDTGGSRSDLVDSIYLVDLELGWDVTENWNVTLGGTNVFDEYPDKIPANGVYANRIGVGLEYPRRSAPGYDGGSWYLRTSYSF